MKRFISFLVSILFFIWILPLGAFIKPEKEKEACNGQRAVCLCSHLVAKYMADHAGQTLVKTAGSTQKEQNRSSSEKHFSADEQSTAGREPAASLLAFELPLYNPLFIRPIEHVPRV